MIVMRSNSIFTFCCRSTSGTACPNGENTALGTGGLELSIVSSSNAFNQSIEPHYCQHVCVHLGGMQCLGCAGLNLHVADPHFICDPRELGNSRADDQHTYFFIRL